MTKLRRSDQLLLQVVAYPQQKLDPVGNALLLSERSNCQILWIG